jgi:hypothetical protein
MPHCLLPCCPRTMLPLDLLFTIPFTWIVSAGIGNTHGDDGRTALGVECLGLLKLVRACVGQRKGSTLPGGVWYLSKQSEGLPVCAGSTTAGRCQDVVLTAVTTAKCSP